MGWTATETAGTRLSPRSRAAAVKGFIPCSFLDWPGRVAAVAFLPGCTFRCPWCHNASLVLEPERLPDLPLEHLLHVLRNRRGWIDGVVVTGGEPTLHPGLPDLLAEFRHEGFPVRLDTNGSLPRTLGRLLDAGLVDHVAMDVKAPLDRERYARLSGGWDDVEALRDSIRLILAAGVPHTFRTTVVPGLLDAEDLADLARDLPPGSPHVYQEFRPGDTLDPALVPPPPDGEGPKHPSLPAPAVRGVPLAAAPVVA